ncbi:MAG: carboxymuconolactone decarboxylase family protein [Bacteroidota bacterium]
MYQLTAAERALVALGAALSSNRRPCVQAQVSEARMAGLSESRIQEALEVADRARQGDSSEQDQVKPGCCP